MVLINKDANRTMAVGIKYWAANTLGNALCAYALPPA